jgi:hypothetical protein
MERRPNPPLGCYSSPATTLTFSFLQFSGHSVHICHDTWSTSQSLLTTSALGWLTWSMVVTEHEKVGRGREASRASVPTIHGISFRGLSTLRAWH